MLSKIQGCLMGVAVGDAMGMPVELMSRAEILEKTNRCGITGFVHPIQRKIKGTGKLQAGSTTDDWQLTRAIADSLIRCGRYDLMDIALSHVEAFETSTFGWGGTTRSGLSDIKDYFDSRGKKGRSPTSMPNVRDLGMSRGCGNGVAMKISPIAICCMNESFQLEKRCAEIGRLTHADKRSWAAAFAVAEIICTNLYGDEGRIVSVEDSLRCLISQVKWFESSYMSDSDDLFSGRLERLLDLDLLFGPIEALIEKIGVGCLALESVRFAIAVYLRNGGNFRKGILEAVNSAGDADTIASMAGAMIGSVVGIEGIPVEWIEFNKDFSSAIKLGADLHNVLL